MTEVDSGTSSESQSAARVGDRFWVTAAVGWVVIAFGLRGIVLHSLDTRPTNLARFVIGGALLHDLLFAPLVLVAAVMIGRIVRGPARAAVQGALAVSGAVALFSYPLVRGFGLANHNPTSLPYNYARNVAIVLGIVWAVASAIAVVSGRRARADADPRSRHG